MCGANEIPCHIICYLAGPGTGSYWVINVRLDSSNVHRRQKKYRLHKRNFVKNKGLGCCGYVSMEDVLMG